MLQLLITSISFYLGPLSLFPFDVTGDCSKNRYTSIIHYCCCYQNTPYNPQIRKFFMKAGAGDAGLCKKNTMN